MSTTSDTPEHEHVLAPSVAHDHRRSTVSTALRGLHATWSERPVFAPPPRGAWPIAFRRAWLIGFLVLGLELIGFGVWSEIEVQRFGLTADFAAYLQGAFLFGHGHLSPESTSYFRALLDGQPRPMWGNAGEFYLIPLGLLYRIWPHLVLLKWLQDVALVLGQGIAFSWICDLVAARRGADASTRSGLGLIAVGLVLLVANPWFIWASSFDIHSETFAVPFVIAAARDLHRGRRRAWLWAACGMACSAVGVTYVVAVSVSSALTSRRTARPAIGIAALGVTWFIVLKASGFLNLVGPDTFQSIINGGATSAYAFPSVANAVVRPSGRIVILGTGAAIPTYGELLKVVLHHPFNVIKALWVNHANMWGTVSAAGVVGLLWLPMTVPALDILIQGGFVRGFSLPSFQNIVLGSLLSVGTIAVLIWLSERLGTRRRWALRALTILLAANTIVWGATWFPNVTAQWLGISPQAGAQLARIQKEIGPDDEVLGSQGIVGAFGARQWVYELTSLPTSIDVAHGRKVWFILAPAQGIETLYAGDTLAVIAELSTRPGIRLVSQRAGIWLFEWNPPRGTKRLALALNSERKTPTWAVAGASGTAVEAGQSTRWHVTNTGKPGYVLNGDYWLEPAGSWQVSVTLAASATTNVEVWDDTTSKLLKRVILHHTSGRQQLRLTVRLAADNHQPIVNGWGLWSIAPILRRGSSLELRVWTAGPARSVSVYAASIRPAGG